MKPNTDHLVPRDRESVLRIIRGWNYPYFINLEEAKAAREIEAQRLRQEGYGLSYIPNVGSVSVLGETTQLVRGPLGPLSPSGPPDATPHRTDPLAGTFVRGGWRRRRVYPDPDSNYRCIFQVQTPAQIFWPTEYIGSFSGPVT